MCLPLCTPLRPIQIHSLISKILAAPSANVNKDLKKLGYSVSIVKEELSSGAKTLPKTEGEWTYSSSSGEDFYGLGRNVLFLHKQIWSN